MVAGHGTRGRGGRLHGAVALVRAEACGRPGDGLVAGLVLGPGSGVLLVARVRVEAGAVVGGGRPGLAVVAPPPLLLRLELPRPRVQVGPARHAHLLQYRYILVRFFSVDTEGTKTKMSTQIMNTSRVSCIGK